MATHKAENFSIKGKNEIEICLCAGTKENSAILSLNEGFMQHTCSPLQFFANNAYFHSIYTTFPIFGAGAYQWRGIEEKRNSGPTQDTDAVVE